MGRGGGRSLCDVEDLVDVEVGLDRSLALADEIRFVRLVAVLVGAVFLAVDRDRADAELVAGAEDADGDLAAVRAKQLADRACGHSPQSSARARVVQAPWAAASSSANRSGHR